MLSLHNVPALILEPIRDLKYLKDATIAMYTSRAAQEVPAQDVLAPDSWEKASSGPGVSSVGKRRPQKSHQQNVCNPVM